MNKDDMLDKDDEKITNMLLAKEFMESGDDYFKLKEEVENILKKVQKQIEFERDYWNKKKKEVINKRKEVLKPLLRKESACKFILSFLNKVKKGRLKEGGRRKKIEKNENSDNKS